VVFLNCFVLLRLLAVLVYLPLFIYSFHFCCFIFLFCVSFSVRILLPYFITYLTNILPKFKHNYNRVTGYYFTKLSVNYLTYTYKCLALFSNSPSTFELITFILRLLSHIMHLDLFCFRINYEIIKHNVNGQKVKILVQCVFF
jgi:hypothetical protein